MAPSKKQSETKVAPEVEKKSASTKTEKAPVKKAASTKTEVAEKKAAPVKTEKAQTKKTTKTEVTEKKVKETPVKTESTETEEHVPRKKASKESVDADFATIETRINDEIARLEEKKKTDKSGKVTGIQFLKQLRKLHKLLHRDASKVLKIKKNNRPANDQSGFKKPVKVSDEICKFFGWDNTKLYSRTDVTREICKYISDHKLQDNDNKRIINPDVKLTALLQYDPKTMPIEKKTGKPSPLYYYLLQKLLTRHFPESKSKVQK